MKKPKFEYLPTTREEMKERGWKQLDVILITGDAYIDSPYIGVAVVGRMLEKLGFKVGIIGQPDVSNDDDIKRLGEPKVYWGVSGGSIDSMVANYTATKKFRNSDDYTPGGKNNKRPDRAVNVYTNLIRKNFKGTVPIVLGGIEASLRRITHYDYWTNKLRKPVLFDSKADLLIYGMGEKYKGRITRTDLRTPTPYNTYTNAGLPPTPIAMVGREAIHAALHPADGTSLYFVARGDGSHVFSDTLNQHNRAVREYQLKRRADYRSSPPPRQAPADNGNVQ